MIFDVPRKHADIYKNLNKVVLRDDKTGSAVVM